MHVFLLFILCFDSVKTGKLLNHCDSPPRKITEDLGNNLDVKTCPMSTAIMSKKNTIAICRGVSISIRYVAISILSIMRIGIEPWYWMSIGGVGAD